jgi:type II secretory pathway pseudopilin PulG
MLLFWVMIAGVMLAAAGQSWHNDARRDQEDELVFRGNAYARALAAYAGQHGGRYPTELRDLVEDEHTGVRRRYLRALYRDPVTNSDRWGLVRRADGGITGVFSDSDAVPIRQTDGVVSYRDWIFSALPQVGPGTAAH